MLGPIWWIAAMFVTGETPYDRWTGVRITQTSSGTTLAVD